MLKQSLERYHIVLASQSPRRRELLGRLNVVYEVLAAKGEEQIHGGSPEEIVVHLARQKAEEVYELKKGNGDCEEQPLLVIGADTIVVYENQILGKPQGKVDAYEMLHMLSGKKHQVYTGVCIVRETVAAEVQRHCFYEKTDVVFARLSDTEIWDYINSGDCFDKAGGYGIQGDFAAYVKGINGDYNNVVGLPVARLYQELKELVNEIQ